MKIYDLNTNPTYVPASGEIDLDSSYEAVRCLTGKVYYLVNGYISKVLVPPDLLTDEQDIKLNSEVTDKLTTFLEGFNFSSLGLKYFEHFKDNLKYKISVFLADSGQLEIELPMKPLKEYEKILEDLGYTQPDSMETNGWQCDFWMDFEKNNSKLQFEGSLYYGGFKLIKC